MKYRISIIITALFVALSAPGAAAQNGADAPACVAVADGTQTSPCHPLFSYWANTAQRCQSIYPAEMLDGVIGRAIDSLHYDVTYGNSDAWGAAEWKIYVGATSRASLLSSFVDLDSLTLVYSGPLAADETHGMGIRLDRPFVYSGNNLAVEFRLDAGVGFSYCFFLGSALTNASRYTTDMPNGEGVTVDVLPKLTLCNTGSPQEAVRIELPVCFDFDGIVDRRYPEGWTLVHDACGGGHNCANYNMLQFEFAVGDPSVVLAPELASGAIGGMHVEADYHANDNTTWNSIYTYVDFGYLTDTADYNTFVALTTLHTDQINEHYSFDLPACDATRLAIRGRSTYGWHLFDLDNICLTRDTPTDSVEADSTVCASELPLTWNNATFTEAGTLRDTLTAADGSDSIVVMTLHVLPTYDISVEASICDNQDTIFEGTAYYEAGSYPIMLQTAAGCDSLRTLNLSVRSTSAASVTEVVSPEEMPYTFNGRNYSMPTTADTIGLSNAAGCDSMLVFNLYVREKPCPQLTTAGTDFWVAYLYNYPELFLGIFERANILTLIASGNEEADITVENPLANWSTSGHVSAGGSVTINIPKNIATNNASFSPQPQGFHVTSTAPVNLYSSNYQQATQDIATILPTEALRTHYIAQDYPGQRGAQVCVLAIADSTNITFTPPVGVAGHALGQAFSIMLMAGQKYTLWNTNYTYSGMDIRADKEIAVFQGSSEARVPVGYDFADHLYEQAIPVDDWGREYILVPTAARAGGDRVKVTSAADGCVLTLDGDTIATLNTGQTHEFHLASGPARRLLCSKPASVGLFIASRNYGGVPGDPAYVILAPVEQGVCQSTFCAINTQLTSRHFANITTTTADLANMTLDGAPIGAQFSPLDSVYSYAQMSLGAGVHTIANASGVFTAYFYGLGGDESYAYSAGMALTNLSNHIIANGHNADTYLNGLHVCEGDTVDLTVVSNSEDTSVRWFVDGQELELGGNSSFGLPCTEAGFIAVTAIMHGPTDSLWTDTLSLGIVVGATSASTEEASFCDNQSYTWHDSTYTALSDSATFHTTNAVGCDSTAIIRFNIRPTSHSVDAIAACDSAVWQDGTTRYAADSSASVVYTNIAGCDSTVTLWLSVGYSSAGDTVADECDSFAWHGQTYTASTDTPTATLQNAAGCDSTVTLHLTIRNSTSSAVAETVVENSLPHTFNGATFTADTAGAAITIVGAAGCDSTIDYSLTVFWNKTVEAESTVCASELPLQWNARTFTEACTQRDTLGAADGSDSVVVMTLHVLPTYDISVEASICDNQDTLFEGTAYSEEGSYPIMLQTAAGCDSLRTLTLAVRATSAGDTVADECDSFAWHGQTYTASTDTPTATLQNAAGCDSTVTLHLTIRNSTSSAVAETVVENSLPHTFNGVAFAADTIGAAITIVGAAGCDSTIDYTLNVHWNVSTHIDSAVCNTELPIVWEGLTIDTTVGATVRMQRHVVYTAHTGADSTVSLGLTVRPVYDLHTYDTVYGDDSRSWEGLPCGATGIYSTMLHTAVGGCDSLRTLHLQRWPRTRIDSTLCQNRLPIQWNGLTFGEQGVSGPDGALHGSGTRSNRVHTMTDSVHVATAAGGDSLVVMTLAVRDTSATLLQLHACDSIRWHQNTYTASTTAPRFDTVGAAGCDSVTRMHLTVDYTHRYTDRQTVCDRLTWIDGHIYTTDTTGPMATLTTTKGCDSLVTLGLTVHYSKQTELRDTICHGQIYTWLGDTIGPDVANIYTTQHYTLTHTLQTTEGCDSTVTIELTKMATIYVGTAESADCSTQTYSFDIVFGNELPYYTWTTAQPPDPSLDGQQGLRHMQLAPQQTTTYMIYADYHESPLCPATATATLRPIVVPEARMRVNPDMLTGEAHTLTAYDVSDQDYAERAWYVDGLLQAEQGRTLHADARADTGSVALALVVGNGQCNDTALHLVPIRRVFLAAPNVFTPDAETNRLFEVVGRGIASGSLYVYDRNGLLVYSADDYTAGWDGRRTDGSAAPQGAYVWKLVYSTADHHASQHSEVGTVTLLR